MAFFCSGEAAAPVITDVGAFLGRGCRALSPLEKVWFERLLADQAFERGDRYLVGLDQVRSSFIVVERAVRGRSVRWMDR